MGSDSLFFIIIAICLIMSAYFSATETAFLSLNRIRMKNMADKGNKRAALVLELEEKYDNLLSTILIGNNIVNILSSSLATILFVKMLGDAKGASVSTIVTTVLVLIFGEISPKSIAKESPDKFALFSAPIIAVLVKILTPVNFVFAQWKKLLSHIFKSEEETGITEEELLTIVDEAQAGGGIGEDERVLIRSAIEFDELEAVDIYTPRIDIVGIPVDMSKDEIAKIFADTGYSRLPVYEENIDQIIDLGLSGALLAIFVLFLFLRKIRIISIVAFAAMELTVEPPTTVPTVKVVFGVSGTLRSAIFAMARPNACVALGMPNAAQLCPPGPS